ncbi:hypothetical protein CfE428DRAFT_5546 [Chthoniobacter flavus Ellin428]|uniref:Uncharacterized protein n=1 Tax=Chthoniobacter flavus Ellin428 TaxID=497964 RepID=B4D9F6_9BACT|nr:hypothetical protein [Chthoniobacter flavus]EDY16917.1 hypothetical protein CfE428DRAFT_5546 [Chthoniobacter flavus Ellin428]TCO87798.1 hypothetical protein EV701_12097 [Chthoniobacter flavus]
MNNSAKVILLNRMLGYDGLNTALKGYSGKAYGPLSRYSPEHKCHVVELSLAEYESAREDLFKKMRQGMSGFFIWEPKLVLGEAVAAGMAATTAPSATATPTPTASTAPTAAHPDLPRAALLKAAKAAGVKVTRGSTREELLKAITGGHC